jgi:hypothetical protein
MKKHPSHRNQRTKALERVAESADPFEALNWLRMIHDGPLPEGMPRAQITIPYGVWHWFCELCRKRLRTPDIVLAEMMQEDINKRMEEIEERSKPFFKAMRKGGGK